MSKEDENGYNSPALPEISAEGPLGLIRERISALPSLELNDHCNEYDAIHAELERALSQIDVN